MNFRTLATAALIVATAAVFGRPSKARRAVRPAAPVAATAEQAEPTPAPLTADDINGEVPADDEVIEAARSYESARLARNTAERSLNKAKKTLERTPDGTYGQLTVERHASTRKVADLDAIRAVFAEHGLGDVPMKTCSASLAFTWAAEQEAAELELLAA